MPTEFFDQLVDLLQALWATPNRWLRRLIVGALAIPFVSMLMGMLWGPLAMMTALIPILLIVGWATLAVDPLVIGILNRYDFGKKFTGWAVFIAGLELAWAFFCGVFPLENDFRVSFTALFALLAAAALAGGATYLKLEARWPKKLAKLLVFAAAICGVILLIGGRKNTAENASKVRSWASGKAATSVNSIFNAPDKSPKVPLCDGAQNVSLDFSGSREIEIPLSTECWSGWVTLPPSADFSARNGDKSLEFLFVNGKHWKADGGPGHLGEVPSSTFRIRGEGEKVKIYISPSA
jgi:hypothetical protein